MLAISLKYPAVNKIAVLCDFWQAPPTTGLKETSFLNFIVNDFFEGKDHTKSQVITGITAAAQEVKGKIPILQKEEQNFLEEKQKWQDKNTLLKSLNIGKTFRDLEITLRNLPYHIL